MKNFINSAVAASALTLAPMAAEAAVAVNPNTDSQQQTLKAKEIENIYGDIGAGFRLVLGPLSGGIHAKGLPNGFEERYKIEADGRFNLGELGDLDKLEIGLAAAKQSREETLTVDPDHDTATGVGPLVNFRVGSNEFGVKTLFNTDEVPGDPDLMDLQASLMHSVSNNVAVGLNIEREHLADWKKWEETLRIGAKFWSFAELGLTAGAAQINNSGTKGNAAVLGADLTFTIPVVKAFGLSEGFTDTDTDSDDSDSDVEGDVEPDATDDHPCGEY